MKVRLETLELTPEELEASREAVRKMAYFRWLEAGEPTDGGLDHWAQAERDWIERYYVPRRDLTGSVTEQG